MQSTGISWRVKIWGETYECINCFWKIYLKEGTKQDIRKEKWAYTLFLVHIPYSINKEIRIHVFYCPWHPHFIKCVMDMSQNISSGISKSLFRKFRIKVKCTSAVIFLWDITKNKKTQLSYWGISYIHAIWYISESVYLSNCVFVTRHVAPDQ